MVNQLKKSLLVFLFLTPVILLTSGCSSTNSKSGLEDPGFRKRVGNGANQAVPIPVEIAKDIERISEDGLLVYSDNPSYSRGFKNFSTELAARQEAGQAYPEVQDCSNLREQDLANCQLRNEQIVQMLESEKNGGRTPSVESEEDLDIAKKTKNKNADGDGVLSEDDLMVQEDSGPLALSLKRKKSGPLNFRNKISGSSLPPLQGGKTVSYIVRLGDTLMKIAFEKYANYFRWKDIYKINKNKMKSPERMQVGTELTIKNVKYVYIQRDGQPYLIRKMDTLKSISQTLYGTPDRWEDIWKNNPQLIKNPKRIYAGFTLYYSSPNKDNSVERREPTSYNVKKNKTGGSGPLKGLPTLLPKKSTDLF